MLGIFDSPMPEGSEKPYYFNLERAGIVTRVGSGVANFTAGDHVVSLWPGYYSTLERVPATSCRKIPSTQDFKVRTRNQPSI